MMCVLLMLFVQFRRRARGIRSPRCDRKRAYGASGTGPAVCDRATEGAVHGCRVNESKGSLMGGKVVEVALECWSLTMIGVLGPGRSSNGILRDVENGV